MNALWDAFMDLLPGQWDLFKQWAIWEFLLRGLWVAVQLAFFGIILSLIVGVLMAVARLSPVPIVKYLASTYIEVFRATPLLLLFFFVFFGAGRFNTGWARDVPLLSYFVDDTTGDLTPEASAVLALTLYNSAVVAEIIRAGILSISKGIIEAGRALGLTYIQTMNSIAIPMALRRMAPGLVSQLITLFKDTSLAFLISVEELLRRGRILWDSPTYTDSTIEIFIVVSLLYFIPNYALSLIAGRLEKGPEMRAWQGEEAAVAEVEARSGA
jgi:putative glutamine transport system permease protein